MMNRKKRKKWYRCRQGKGVLAFLLALLLSFSPCSLWLGGNVRVDAATFTITKLKKDSIIQDGNFYFYGKILYPEVFYWIKNDGSPLFCIQKTAHIITDLYGGEVIEEYDRSSYLNEEQYELISLVLQCCGMIQGEDPVLEPGTYLAGQAAVWGITSPNWRDSQYFRQEMEIMHRHLDDWYDTSAEDILAQSQEAVDRICEAIDAYYGDNSPYIPAFASKYEKKAPVWTVLKQKDGSCEAVFMLQDKSEAIKEFAFALPEGWSCEWQEDKVIFRCEQAEEGLVSITGKAKPGTELAEAMPIGLVHIVGPANFPHFQRLASEVECEANWSCYFKLLVSAPEDEGSWYLPQVDHYRHQETFTALYGAGIEKLDGETMEPISHVEFQPLEYFDARQLDNTCLDRQQIETWKGWKADCSPEITDRSGHLEHWDRREYFYDKTYCSGHPEPEITYEGSSESQRELLQEEAEEAWETEVEECSRICDFHRIDGSGEALLEEDRNLAYQQFIHLVYGYSFRETKPAPGYLPYGEHQGDKEIGKVFLTSVQAGGDWQEGEPGEQEVQEERQQEPQKVNLSQHKVETVQAPQAETASNSNAEYGEEKEEKAENQGEKEEGEEQEIESGEKEEAEEDEKSEEEPERTEEEFKKTGERSERTEEELEKAGEGPEKTEEELVKTGEGLERADEELEKGDEGSERTEELAKAEEELEGRNGLKRIKQARRQGRASYIWLTSFVEPLIQEMPDKEVSYSFTMKNYKKTVPPEETPPEETPPEETLPEETPPEETLPEETLPEETPSEETLPEETPPFRPNSPKDSGGGGRRKVEVPVPGITPEAPPETSELFIVPEEPIPQAVSRMGWIEAEYATPSIVQKRKDQQDNGNLSGSLPKTGDRGIGIFVLLLIGSGSGAVLVFFARKRRKAAAFFLGLAFCMPWAGESRAEERAEERTENKMVLYFSTEEVLGEDERAAEEQAESREAASGIQEKITDEYGQQYWLESCQLVTCRLPEREEWVCETIVYPGIESDRQIPESVWFQAEEEDTERIGEGELLQTSVTVSDTYWDNQFQIPLRFCDYDAETYRLQEMEVPKEEALTYLMERQEGLLQAVGCSPTAYQLDGIVWNGVPYSVQGIMYRDALAYGKKRVSDVVVEYAGTLIYPEGEQERWEAVYALSVVVDPLPEFRETEAVLEEVLTAETTAAEPVIPQEGQRFSWIKLRTIAAYTVSLAVLLPIFGYVILLLGRRKRPSTE